MPTATQTHHLGPHCQEASPRVPCPTSGRRQTSRASGCPTPALCTITWSHSTARRAPSFEGCTAADRVKVLSIKKLPLTPATQFADHYRNHCCVSDLQRLGLVAAWPMGRAEHSGAWVRLRATAGRPANRYKEGEGWWRAVQPMGNQGGTTREVPDGAGKRRTPPQAGRGSWAMERPKHRTTPEGREAILVCSNRVGQRLLGGVEPDRPTPRQQAVAITPSREI